MSRVESSPENTGSIGIAQYSLKELAQNEALYQSLLSTYCTVFNEEPWNENWIPNEARLFIEKEMGHENLKLFLAQEQERVIGFYWGKECSTEEIISSSVEYYLPNLKRDAQDAIALTIKSNLATDCAQRGEGQPPTLYWAFDLGILKEKRGGRVMQQLFRPAIKEQLSKGTAATMYGMTHTDSNFYHVVSNRGARLLLSVSDFVPEEKQRKWVFMVTDMNKLI